MLNIDTYDYNKALYRRNNFGQPTTWYCKPIGKGLIKVFHGIVGKTITEEIIKVNRNEFVETTSRFIAKYKVGYKQLSEIKDNVPSPVEEELLNYLNTYLPKYRTTADGSMLPMLAKVYDNTNNRVFNKSSYYIGQWKINGLRCFISAVKNDGDLFHPIKLIFQSREGTYWNSLRDLEEYLLGVLDYELLDKMVEEHYILDGELYLPGHTVNEINHFVKDSASYENRILQYWCYDLAIENTIQHKRLEYLFERMNNHIKYFNSKEEHLNNENRLIILPNCNIVSNEKAISVRDEFINCGFEGLIMRNPDAEYQYGKRNLSMIKFKKTTDGKFKIIDIYKEGCSREELPLILCKNDINDKYFETHLTGSQEYQKQILINKKDYIGKYLFVEYSERSGINQVPFHVKETRIIN